MTSQYHFVLLHGGCFGAWTWFSIEARLQKAGHKVTALDFAGAGIHPAEPNDIATFDEYHKPALDFFESLPENPEEKVSSPSPASSCCILILNRGELVDCSVLIDVLMSRYLFKSRP